jgi:hypothetical protein
MRIVNVQIELHVFVYFINYSILYIFLSHLFTSTVIIYNFICTFLQPKASCVLIRTVKYIPPSRAKVKNERSYPSGSSVCLFAVDLDYLAFFI